MTLQTIVVNKIIAWFKKIPLRLWEKDPGYFRLKQSFKTVLAILISCVLTYQAPLMLRIFAAIAAGFSMQAIEGDTKKQQITFIFIADSCYFGTYALSAFSQHLLILNELFLILLAFFALYLRRFGKYFAYSPMFIWIFAFFGVAFPVNNKYQILNNLLGLFIGFVVKAIVFFLIFPENKIDIFFKNVQKFFYHYALALQWVLSIVIFPKNKKNFISERSFYREHLWSLIRVNDNITRSFSNLTTSRCENMKNLYLRQYALTKVLSMILEGFETLIRQRQQIPVSLRSHIFTLFSILASAICNIHFEQDKFITNMTSILEIAETQLENCYQQLDNADVEQLTDMIPLLNILLGLRLMLKNLQLLRNFYDDSA